MNTRLGLLVLAALALTANSARAQQYWEKKPWQNWSKEDCRKMLEDSPWAQQWARQEVRNDPLGYSTGGTARESRPEVHYILQFRSALPLRQAVVRQAQILQKYDQLKPEEKKAFDQSAEDYLARKYDELVVHVVYGSNVQLYERQMAAYWQAIEPGAVPVDAFLITERGERIRPIRFISPRSGTYEFELIFPRRVNGQPIIRPEDKTLKIEFPHPNIGGMGAERMFVEFKLAKMNFKGELAY